MSDFSRPVIIASIIRVGHVKSSVSNASRLLSIITLAENDDTTHKSALHVHWNTAFTNQNWILSKRTISIFDDITNLKGVVLSYAFLTPVERLWKEHTLRNDMSKPFNHNEDTQRARTRDRPWTLTVKSPNCFVNKALRSYLQRPIRRHFV